MANLISQSVSPAGTTLALVAASAGGDTIPADDHSLLVATNGSGSPITITAVTTATEGGLAVADETITVPAGGTVLAGPFPARLYANSADQRCHLTYSASASLTVGSVS